MDCRGKVIPLTHFSENSMSMGLSTERRKDEVGHRNEKNAESGQHIESQRNLGTSTLLM